MNVDYLLTNWDILQLAPEDPFLPTRKPIDTYHALQDLDLFSETNLEFASGRKGLGIWLATPSNTEFEDKK